MDKLILTRCRGWWTVRIVGPEGDRIEKYTGRPHLSATPYPAETPEWFVSHTLADLNPQYQIEVAKV